MWVSLVQLAHLILILFVILAPFTQNISLLQRHALLIPFLWAHWLTNSNHCALTYGERLLRDLTQENPEEHQCLTCQVLDPIFQYSEDRRVKFSYVAITFLWFITMTKLYGKKMKSKE